MGRWAVQNRPPKPLRVPWKTTGFGIILLLIGLNMAMVPGTPRDHWSRLSRGDRVVLTGGFPACRYAHQTQRVHDLASSGDGPAATRAGHEYMAKSGCQWGREGDVFVFEAFEGNVLARVHRPGEAAALYLPVYALKRQ